MKLILIFLCSTGLFAQTLSPYLPDFKPFRVQYYGLDGSILGIEETSYDENGLVIFYRYSSPDDSALVEMNRVKIEENVYRREYFRNNTLVSVQFDCLEYFDIRVDYYSGYSEVDIHINYYNDDWLITKYVMLDWDFQPWQEAFFYYDQEQLIRQEYFGPTRFDYVYEYSNGFLSQRNKILYEEFDD